MAKASKRLSLSSKKNKARKTRQGIVSTATRDDVNMLLKVAEIYNTSYMILKQRNGFGDNTKKQKTMKNLETNIHKEVRKLNYLKGLHQNLS
jgi:hypothetical protein